MKKITQIRTGAADVMQLEDSQLPEPGAGEVRVRINAAGVNPVDVAVRAGLVDFLGAPPFTIGWDLSGVVEAVGPGVTAWRTGDRVFGMPAFPAQVAAYATHTVVPAAGLNRTPDSLSDAEAAALPLAGLTAWQALVTHGRIAEGEHVLIHGGAGGVGHLAVQIAKARGARVTATASPEKVTITKGYGADIVVDYTQDQPEGPYDLVLDTQGAEHVMQSLATVRDGGRLIALLPFGDEAEQAARARGIQISRIVVQTDTEGLDELTVLIAKGQLRVTVAGQFPLSEVAAAHEALAERPVGKIVLIP
ncbi:NADPH:quinone reductase [Primorskyibacter flagellatus]|uniref:NADPH:quinone reductase n=1 Tax=Primorskyibacter flagellatus TaxID=1387277 RepID=A0A917EAH8_9RHOB|nr:NADP-dependent oxidoreductase [Primorskyibacter flagellatus]GGE19361.1 NADPH:quinone reductase [Primorskyibacter flagellatus]